MRYIILGLIKFYQIIISPILGGNCRFLPTCSAYSYQAIKEYGAWRGSILGVKRISKCHPWHKGGYDPVPEKNNK